MGRWRKYRYILLGVAIALLVLGPAAWHHYLGPAKIRRYAITALEQLTGGEVNVAAGSYSLFSGVTLKKVDVYERGAESTRPVVRIGAITVDPKLRELLRGNFAVRRVVVDGLAINVELDKEMRWPAAKMFASGGGGPVTTLPTVTISDLSLRVACPTAPERLPPVELSQINLSLKRAHKEQGKYDVSVWSRDCGLGGFDVRVEYFPQPDIARGSAKWDRIALGPRVQRMLPASARRAWDDLNIRNGHVTLSANFSWTGKRARPFDYDARILLRDLAFRHARMPCDAAGVHADLRLKNEEFTLESLAGNFGVAPFTAKAAGRLAAGRVEGEFEGDVRGVPLDDALRSALPAEARELWDAMKPSGRVGLAVKGRMVPGRDRPEALATVDLEEFACAPPQLPFPLRDVRARLTIDEQRVKVESLAGTVGTGAFRVPSASFSLTGDEAFDAAVEVDKLAYDGPCAGLLPPAFAGEISKDLKEFLSTARTAWKVDLTAALRRKPGEKSLAITGTVNLTDGLFAHPAFGKPLTQVRTHAKYTGGVLDLGGCVADWGPAKLEIKPVKVPLLPRRPFTLNVTANGIVLDSELRALLPAEAKREWDHYKPAGLCDAVVTARVKPGAPPEVDVTADLRDGSLLYADFPYLIRHVRGRVEVRNGAFISAHVEAKHDDADLVVDVKDLSNAERSGLRVAVRAANVPVDKALYEAILPDFRPVWDAIAPTGVITDYDMVFNRFSKATGPGWYDFTVDAKFNDLKVDCGLPISLGRANVIISRGEGDDAGRLAFSGTASTPATKFERIPLSNTSLAFYWRDNRLYVKDLVSDCYGGTLTGTAMLNLAVPRNEFSGKVSLYNADIAQVLADSGGESIAGRVSATSKISAELVTGGAFGAVGGMVIRSGRIGELPGLLGVLNLFVLNRPDAPVFHTLEVAYELRGPEMTIYEINLLGEILSLYGKGFISEDKKLMFRFTPEFGPQLPRIPVVTDLLSMVKGNLIPLTIRGDYNDPVFMVNPLMPVTNIMQTIFGQIAPIGTKLTEMLPKMAK